MTHLPCIPKQSTWYRHKKGTQGLTEQAWLLCLTLNQNDVLGTVHNLLKCLMDNGILCHVIVIVLQKCKADTQFLQVIILPRNWRPQQYH